jgi:hypothetical protein
MLKSIEIIRGLLSKSNDELNEIKTDEQQRSELERPHSKEKKLTISMLLGLALSRGLGLM